ncbi:SPOSA6832_03762 [Sporobolomyces salmonicolor]|uniref:SPOSA6832_03762-mRNA-1:cds n=1 Tax=Sporidiobolus salmonicolor TaxID=5005 RepID=A0A0D6EQX8_SPOSA|nr:SPOSA6832_03762 [Sporobolomyces salmonicolor]
MLALSTRPLRLPVTRATLLGAWRRQLSSTPSRPSTASSSSTPPLIGSAPYYPRHLVIHTPHPSSSWPSHLESTSRLYKELGKRWAGHPELSKLGFGVTDGGKATEEKGAEWSPERTKFDEPPEGPEEVYSATVYPDFLTIPGFSLSTLPSFESRFLSLPPASAPPLADIPLSAAAPPTGRTHIFVCTHGSRDCRCGDLGEPLYQALLKEVSRRKLGGELKDGEDGVRLARIAHIGGHKWAGNALVYREGAGCDWYGLLRDSDASTLLDYATSRSLTPWYSRWRGRLTVTPEAARSAHLTHSSGVKSQAEDVRNELGEQVELRFETWEGEEIKIKGYEGESLMETARRHDLPSILATCGGHCECATCHVHIPPLTPASSSAAVSSPHRKPIPVPHLPSLPEISDEEEEQLDFAIGADDHSRLACQIPVTKELGEWVAQGGKIKLPRY